MSGRKYYCICDANCRFETMTKEQILAAIAEAAAGGLVFDTDAAFITKVKENNSGSALSFWLGTQAEYNAIVTKGEKDPQCFYILTDCATNAELAGMLKQLDESKMDAVEAELHIADKNNPHGVTPAQIGAAAADALNAYVPRAGTALSAPLALSGAFTNGLISLNNTNGDYPNAYIRYQASGVNKAAAGYYGAFAFLSNEVSMGRIGVDDNGNPQYRSSGDASTAKTLLHAGNFNSYAAPSGYGLGTNSIKIATSSALDAVSGCGFVGLATNIIAPTRGGWGYTVLNENGTYGTQVVYSIDGWELKRTKAAGVWGEWEWVTPPLLDGEEYRVVERLNGNVLYKKRINFGDAPAVGTSKTVEAISGTGNIVAIEGIARSSDQLVARPLPAFTNDGLLAFTVNATNQTSVTLRSHDGASKFTGAYNVSVVVTYTKY